MDLKSCAHLIYGHTISNSGVTVIEAFETWNDDLEVYEDSYELNPFDGENWYSPLSKMPADNVRVELCTFDNVCLTPPMQDWYIRFREGCYRE